MRLTIFWCLASGRLSLADPIFESTTSANKPSSETDTTVDTMVYTRILDHDAINQNQILASRFSKAQSIIASAADVSQRSPTSIPVLKGSRAHRDADEQSEGPAYFTMTLLVNGYDVTVPILRENATEFCKSMTSEMKSSASGTKTYTSKSEPTEAPNATDLGETDDPEPKATEEVASGTAIDTPSPSTKSHESDAASSQYSDLPADPLSKTSNTPTPSSPESSSISKSPTKKPSSTVSAIANVTSAPDHASASITTHNSATESLSTPETTSPYKHTANSKSTTTTEEYSTLTTTSPTSLIDDAGKSRDVSQVMADNSKAWASYSLYIAGLHSRLVRRESNPRVDTITSTAKQKAAKSPTTSAEDPSETEAKVATRQQRQFSQAAGLRDILPWFRSPFVWRRNGYHLHNASEIEQVQGFSSKSAPNKRQSPYLPAHHDAAEDQGSVNVVKAHEEETEATTSDEAESTTTNEKETQKPTFGFDPHPHPARPSTQEIPRPSSTLRKTKSPASTGAEPTTTPDQGDAADPALPSKSPYPGNATQTSSGNVTSTGPTSDAWRKPWPKNPLVEPIFWGAGAWYLLMAYWEGYQQARGEWGWGWTEGLWRWAGGVMVRYL